MNISLSDFFIPIFITLIMLLGVLKKVNIIDEFTVGAKENLYMAFELIPTLILLMTAVGMFISSGCPEKIAELISPITEKLGFPDECVSLAFIRPISGSGALATLETILSSVSPDSFAGRVASVLMGSTETTFYTITVYFSSLKQKADTKIFVASIASDLAGFVFSALVVRLMFR